jgi:hypothetical protein
VDPLLVIMRNRQMLENVMELWAGTLDLEHKGVSCKSWGLGGYLACRNPVGI